MSDKTNDFLQGIEEVKELLLILQFKLVSIDKKGYAYYVKFQKETNIVEFLFGPSDWDVEIIIHTSKGKFAFKDLLQIPVIAKWVNENRYVQENGRNVKNELRWSVELLKISLPLIQ